MSPRTQTGGPAAAAPPAAGDSTLPGHTALGETFVADTGAGAGTADAPEEPRTIGRYELLRPLGRGAMGAVYLARDAQLDRHVALKLPHPAAAADPQLRARFLREARAAATLHHPHLCPVFDAGEAPGPGGEPRLYLTMALIEGRTLRQAAEGPQPPRTAARLIRKLADAMAHAHGRGVIHRDLKPANVMLDADGRPSITDFGLARRDTGADAAVRVTRAGAVLGTPAYMSPEQIAGDPDAVGPRADIYALGVMLYELLTGRLPFEGTVSTLLGKVLTEDPRPPSELQEGVDPALEAIWAKMTARDPADRFATMAEVRDALTAWLKRGGADATVNATAAAPAGPPPAETVAAPALPDLPEPPRVRRGARRRSARGSARRPRPRWALPAAAVAALLLVGVVTITFLAPDGTPQTITVNVPGEVTDVTVGGGEPAPPGGEPGPAGPAEPDPAPVPAPLAADAAAGDDDGWVDLFDGRTLDGWTGNGNDVWAVEDGLLVGRFAAGPGPAWGQLRTARPYGDVEVRAVFRAAGETDSGLTLRDAPGEKQRLVEVNVRPAQTLWHGAIWSAEPGGRASASKIAPGRAARAAAARGANGEPPGWDVLTVRAAGERVSAALNGVPTQTADLPGLPPAGPLSLLLQGVEGVPAEIAFRSVRVRPLTSEGAPADDADPTDDADP